MNEYFQKGVQLSKNERFEEAIEAFTMSIITGPVAMEAYFNRGLARFKLKKMPEALADFQEALHLKPQDPEIISQLGITHHLMGKVQEALQYLDRAVALDRENPYRYSSRAFIRAKYGDVFGAIDDYEFALKLDPEDAIALNNLGLIEQRIGFEKSAKERFDAADRIADTGKTFEKPDLAQLLAQEDQNPAEKVVLEQLKRKPQQQMQPKGTGESPDAPPKPELKDYLSVIKEVLLSRKGYSEFLDYWRKRLSNK